MGPAYLSYIALVILFAVVAPSVRRNSWMRRRGLRSLPGPWGLLFIGNLFDINIAAPWLTYTAWGKRYGGIVHCRFLGDDFVIINDVKIVHELLEQRSAIYADRPSVSFVESFGVGYNTALTPYGNKWRLHRKLFNIAFNKQVSMAYKPMQIQKAHQVLQSLIASPQDYAKHIQTFSGSVVAAIIYGYDTIPGDDPFVSKAIHIGEIVLDVVTAERVALFSAFPILSYIPSWLPGGRYKQWAGKIRTLAREVKDEPVNYVKQRMTSGSASKSLVNDLLSTDIGRDVGSDYDEIVKEVAASAFWAGQDPTFATVLVFILAMTLYPDVQAKAQEEIDRIVGQDCLPDFSDRVNLPYVEAIFLETLRWHPIGPLGFPHVMTSDDVYNGMYIPEGSTVLINVWAMTRDEARYPDPTAFIPERHLNADGKIAEDFLVPIFGAGRRICPGRYVAEQSIWAIVVSILATLHISKAKNELGNEIDVSPEFTPGIVSHPKPFPCSIVPRSSKVEQLIRMNNALDE